MTVKEFCSKYGMKYQTVYKRIKNNKNKSLDGHIKKEKGKSLELDEFAENFLKSIPVQIKELEQECLQVSKENDALADEIDRLNREAVKDYSEIEKLRSQLNEQNDRHKSEIVERDKAIADLEKVIADLHSEIEKLHAEMDSKKGLKGLFGSKN